VRPSAPCYLPWPASFFGCLALLLGIALILVELDLVTFAWERLGMHHRTAVALLFASLLGSAINIPVARLAGTTPAPDRIASVWGVPYVIPEVDDWPGTIVAVNVGGALVPILLSAYLFHAVGHGLQLLCVTAAVAGVCHRTARIEPGVGIVLPICVPPAVSALVASLVAPDVSAAAAYIGGALGTLIGADLLNLGELRDSGAAVASIGGAGTFDGIFLTGIVAVLLA
jgi:uncharacterized membrane protein